MNRNRIYKIVNIILISIIFLFIIFVCIFHLLGSKIRVGYLTDFNLNIDETLAVNNLENIKDEFTVDEKLDEESIKNYLLTNENISNYVYQFRIRYYDKFFRNSDIYSVYVDLSNLPDYIEVAKMRESGSPYGDLISSKIISEDKIDNINYTLKIKSNITIIPILLLTIFILYLIIAYFKNIKLFLLNDNYKKHRIIITIIYSVFFIIFLIFTLIYNNLLSKKEYTSNLSDLSLIAQSRAGYVYKAKIDFDNPILKIKKDYIQFVDTNLIKIYGYAIEITNKPAYSWHSTNMYYTRNNTFIINNESTNINAYQYPIQIPTYKSDKYKITILAKHIPNTNTGEIEWHLNGNNNFKTIEDSKVSNDYIILTDIRTVNKAKGELNLHFIFPKGITEIESILIENINTNDKFNLSKDGYLLFNSKDKINQLNNLYIKYFAEFKYNFILIIFADILFCLFWFILLNNQFKYGLNLNNNILYIFTTLFLFTFINSINYSNSYSYKEFIIFFIISFISSISFFIFNIISEKKSLKLEKVFIFNFIIIGILYILIFPPMEVPDEGNHYVRTYDISKGIIIDKNASYLPSEIKIFSKRINSYSDIIQNINMNIGSQNNIVSNSAWPYSPISYFPQTTGMLFGRLLHIQSYLEIYIARIFALIFSCFSLYLSIKYIPCKKITLYFISFFPMVIQQTVSFSADSVLIWASLSYISLILYLKYSKNDSLSYSDYLLLSFLLLIIFITKNVYLFLNLLLLLIPKNKFKINKYASIFLIIFFVFMPYFIWNKINNVYGYSFSVNDSELNRNLIIHSPIKYLIIFINTLIKNSNFYFSSMIGRYLGWLEINIGNFYYYCFVLLFIIFLLLDYDDRIKIDVKLLSFIIIGITFTLISTALYLVWTPHEYTVILGVQGRYFIPVLFLLFLTLNFKYFEIKPDIDNKFYFLVISMLHIGILYIIFDKFY